MKDKKETKLLTKRHTRRVFEVMLIRWSAGQLDTIIDDSMILLKFKSANLQEKKKLYQKQNQKKGTEQSPPEREGDSFLGRLGEMGEMRWEQQNILATMY